MNERFVGIQIGPASFVDEGVDAVLDTLQERVGVNVILLGTVSWLGLKIGRSISWQIDGWPDHGVPEPLEVQGGSYLADHPEFYRNTSITNFRAPDEAMRDRDILEMVIPEARARGMKVIPELMEPLFKYAGHGSANTVQIPNLVQYMEVDYLGRIGGAPCLENPYYRTWWHALIEDHCRSYDIDGIMWCNERRSPLDQLVTGMAPGCFCRHCLAAMSAGGVDPEAARRACSLLHNYFRQARAGEHFTDGALITGLRVLLDNPDFLLLERHWVRRNKDLDRELYGLVKWCDPALEFGLNVWNRNHFNPFRKAQWPWAETKDYADWVKPITYQHQSGGIYLGEMEQLHATLLRDLAPAEMTPIMYRILGLDEAPWDELMGAGMRPSSYVGGQCRATIEALDGELPVLMGIGVDAPRSSPDQAACTPEIVYESVHAAYSNGAAGVIYSPNYASMKLTNL
ncbi:MAG: hypothetical protein F4238_18370, partial [Gemmatimonadetes bacterium]|nr:hypothetical protein [Gemmatimonadota bacterium]